MQTYICKCGKTFKKSSKARSTGYALNDYNPQHECYGCPFIVEEQDWNTKDMKYECRATPQITYSTRCHIGIDDGDHTSCHLYTLDLHFAKRVLNYVKTLDGASDTKEYWTFDEPNSIPKKWRAADFGDCYKFKNCFGLAILPLSFQKNKKGTAARRAVMERYFTSDGKRKDMVSEAEERDIVLQRIEIAKENARKQYEIKTYGKIQNNDEATKEETSMTTAFDLGAMLGTPQTSSGNQIKQIPCDMLIPYKRHMFTLYEGERLDDMVQSIKENGVIIPIIAQPSENGKYEILVGHNRWNASKLAGKATVPTIVKEDLTAEEAETYVIESNLMQRGFNSLKISEQAAVISARYNKMFSQGKRNDIIRELQLIENPDIADEDGTHKTSREKVGEEYGLSRNSIARLLRVNNLTDELKELVDDGTIAIRAAVELSYLSGDEMTLVSDELCTGSGKIDTKKAQQLREYSQNNALTAAIITKILYGIMDDNAAPKPKSVKISSNTYERYFKDEKPDEVSSIIEKALEMYFSDIK